MMARLHTPPLTSLMVLALLLPAESLVFVPSISTPSSSSLHGQRPVINRNNGGGGSSGGRRLGPQPLLASSKPDVKDTNSIISEMDQWNKVVTFDTYINRNTKYIVSQGTSLPEVFFDFWKAVSDIIDEHRATGENRSLHKSLMFVAPYCEELRDYETMDHAHQLLQQSACDGGCKDFGATITHSHYHPNYRHRPRPKQSPMASRHSPHPAFSIDVVYRRGGLKSLTSIRESAKEAESRQGTRRRSSPVRRANTLRADASPGDKESEMAKKIEREKWAAKTRSSLEHAYGMAAVYGKEEAQQGYGSSMWAHRQALAGRGVPESSQEILHATQEWLREVLKDAAASDAATANLKREAATAGDGNKVSPPKATNPTTSPRPSSAVSAVISTGKGRPLVSHSGAGGGLDKDRSTSFSPPTAAEAIAAAAAAAREEEEAAATAAVAGSVRGTSARMAARAMSPVAARAAVAAATVPEAPHPPSNSEHHVRDHPDDHHEKQSTQPRHHTPSVRFRAATTSVAGGLKQAFALATELVTVHHQREEPCRAVGADGIDNGGYSGGRERSPQLKAPGTREVAVGVVGEKINVDTERRGDAGGTSGEDAPPLLPGKELVKRMKNISQYIVARSKTAEEAYSDAWEVIVEMVDRAASRGCNVPTEDYRSRSVPCYGALLVTPDLATYSSDTFFRFQEILNRGLKHLPMEHDISVEAFHPEAVSDATSLDHRFTRSPFPTLHICYHGLREKDLELHPRVAAGTKGKGKGGLGLGSSSSPLSSRTSSGSGSGDGGGSEWRDGKPGGSAGGGLDGERQ